MLTNAHTTKNCIFRSIDLTAHMGSLMTLFSYHATEIPVLPKRANLFKVLACYSCTGEFQPQIVYKLRKKIQTI